MAVVHAEVVVAQLLQQPIIRKGGERRVVWQGQLGRRATNRASRSSPSSLPKGSSSTIAGQRHTHRPPRCRTALYRPHLMMYWKSDSSPLAPTTHTSLTLRRRSKDLYRLVLP